MVGNFHNKYYLKAAGKIFFKVVLYCCIVIIQRTNSGQNGAMEFYYFCFKNMLIGRKYVATESCS